MFRRRAEPPPPVQDPVAALDRAAVPHRLLPLVDEAVASYRRWGDVTARVAAGPLADRLGMLGDQVRDGVLELHAATVRVGEAEHVLAALDPDGATAAFKAAKRRSAEGDDPPELEALEARFASVQRMLNLVADADEQLRVLDARLLASVARGAELALLSDAQGLTAVGDDLDDVLVELGALRSALLDLS